MSNQNLFQLFHEVPDDDTMRELFAVFNIPFPLCEEYRLDPWILREEDVVNKM
jgi:hypothetical protein